MVMVVAAAALAVDTGHIMFRRRTMQTTADVVSLDAVRAVGDRFDAAYPGGALALAASFAQQAAKDRNDFDYDNVSAGASMVVEIGTVNWNTSAFTVLASCTLPGGSCTSTPAQDAAANAVRIVTGSTVDHAFLPGSTALDGEAVSANDAMAGMSIGSELAEFDSDDSPLAAILEDMGGFTLDAVSYDALLAADFAIGDLWQELELGSSDEVFGSHLTVGDAFDGMLSVLNQGGSPSSGSAATALGSISGEVDAEGTFTFGDIIDSDAFSPNEVAGVRVNVLQMMTLMLAAANGDNLVVADLPLSIPGVADIDLRMGVIEPPKLAIGPARQDANGDWVTTAHTAQVRMQLNLELSQKLTVLGQQLTVMLPIYLESGSATAELRSIECMDPFEDSPVGIHAETAAASGHVGQVNDASLTGGSVTVGNATLISAPTLLTATGTGSYSIAGSTADMTFTGPFDQPPAPGTRPAQTVGVADPSLDSLATNLTVSVTPVNFLINATLVANQVRTMLVPIIQSLDVELLSQLVSMPLGFTFGGADVINTSLDCHIRRLAR